GQRANQCTLRHPRHEPVTFLQKWFQLTVKNSKQKNMTCSDRPGNRVFKQERKNKKSFRGCLCTLSLRKPRCASSNQESFCTSITCEAAVTVFTAVTAKHALQAGL